MSTATVIEIFDPSTMITLNEVALLADVTTVTATKKLASANVEPIGVFPTGERGRPPRVYDRVLALEAVLAAASGDRRSPVERMLDEADAAEQLADDLAGVYAAMAAEMERPTAEVSA